MMTPSYYIWKCYAILTTLPTYTQISTQDYSNMVGLMYRATLPTHTVRHAKEPPLDPQDPGNKQY